MGHDRRPGLSRRDLVKSGVAAGVAAACSMPALALGAGTAAQPLITRLIPGTRERLPVIGLGTNAYSVTAAEDLASRREVLALMPELGGTVVDTAPAYGQSEAVVGRLIADIGNRDRLFIATKVTSQDGDLAAARAMIDESFRRLQVERIDLMQVHSLMGTDVLLPLLREQQAAGRFRYVGITTSSAAQYPALLAAMKAHPLDFIQVDYSIANRAAAEAILPLARERGIGVLINMPFGGRRGGNLFAGLAGKALPAFAPDIDVTSWSQFLLKYVVSHPAVTCAIPGTTKRSHLEDNQRAARGRLPDAAQRAEMERYWDALA